MADRTSGNRKRPARKMSFFQKHRKGIKIAIFLFLVGSMIFKGLMQQPQINQNNQQIAAVQNQIAYEENRKMEVDAWMEKSNTDEYIEKVASEKLGLVKKNAKIFIDISEENKN